MSQEEQSSASSPATKPEQQQSTFLNIKIKQEKLTPPPSPTPKTPTVVLPSPTSSNPTTKKVKNTLLDCLIDTSIKPTTNINVDEKKSIEPIKSSNEILAELFQQFGSTPTDSFLADLAAGSSKKPHKEKHKKMKKHKKHKRIKLEKVSSESESETSPPIDKKRKKDVENNDVTDNNNIDNNDHRHQNEVVQKMEKNKKLKKKKDDKHRHRHEQKKSSLNVATESGSYKNEHIEIKVDVNLRKRKIQMTENGDDSKIDQTKIKKEKDDNNRKHHHHHHHHKRSKHKKEYESDDISSTATKNNITTNTDELISKNDESLTKPQKSAISTEAVPSTTGLRGKITIKSLKIFEETLKQADTMEKEKSRNTRNRSREQLSDNSSVLSLSDEETYNRERRRFYERDSDRISLSPDQDSFDDTNYRNKQKNDDRGGRRDRYRHRSDRDRDDHKRNTRSSSRGDDRSSYRRYGSDRRSGSRSRYYDNKDDRRSAERIDKKRLLEIARKNAITMLKKGTLPGTQNMGADAKEKVLVKMRYGGKTVDELTEFCKKLSSGEASGYLSNISDDSEHDEDGNAKAFNHPFVLKDKGPIVMNIRNSVPIPPKTAEQTKAILMQFPVSSGQHHRLNESEWVPVVNPKKSIKTSTASTTVTADVPATTAPNKQTDNNRTNVIAPPVAAPVAATVPPPLMSISTSMPTSTTTAASTMPLANHFAIPQQPQQMHHPPPSVLQHQHQVPPQAQQQSSIHLQFPPPEPIDNTNIFPTAQSSLDVTSIITQRLNAMRKLQDNPHDSEALRLMYNSQKDMSNWANSKFVPGQFTGSTGANVLTPRELTSGFQAWAKRDQLISTVPVSGGMGMHLLQKMGWRPGEGLGRERNGALQPLLLEVKLDKKGLVANEENPNVIKRKQRATTVAEATINLESKHPVSLLGELCAKRKWIQPKYDSVNEKGPAHVRQFIISVELNGQTYVPKEASNTKKEAKAVAAKYALQQMGVLQ